MTGVGIGLMSVACKDARTGGVATSLALSGSTVAENGLGGELIGTLSIVGPDFTGPVTYSITSDPSLKFEIAGVGLDELHVKAATSLDRETQSSYEIGLKAVDSLAAEFTKTVSVTVTNVNEQPTDIALTANSIPENTQPGSVIGVLSTTDVDVGDTFTYSIETDTDARFAISGDNLTVRAGVGFDFETAQSHDVTVRSTDDGGLFTTKLFTINITDIVEAITDITLSPSAIAEDASPGDTIGTLTSTSTNVGSSFTYSIILDADAKFVIAADLLKVRTGAGFDFETDETHAVTVRSTSVDNPAVTFDEILTINITDINEIPTAIIISSGSLDVPEDAVDGTTIVTYATTDPDTGDTHTYSLITASSDFELVGNALKVKTGATLTIGTTDLTIRSTDSGNLTFDEVSTVNVIASGLASLLDLNLTGVQGVHDAANETAGNIVDTGGSVSQLTDLTGNGNHWVQATAANQLTTGDATKDVNGLNTLYSDGSFGKLMDAAKTLNDDFWVVLIGRKDLQTTGGSSLRGAFSVKDDVEDNIVSHSLVGTRRRGVSDRLTYFSGAGSIREAAVDWAVGDSACVILNFIKSGATVVYMDGVSRITFTGHTIIVGELTLMGDVENIGRAFAGSFCEGAFGNGTLTATEIANITAHSNSKWGTPA